MNFDLSEDQVALRDTIRGRCEGRFDPARIRAGFDRGVFTELADTGVFSLRADGFGWADAAITFQELGRALVPGPLVWSHLAHGVVDGIVGGLERPGAGQPVVVEHRDTIDALVVLDDDGIDAVTPAALDDAAPLDWPLDPLTPMHRLEALPAGRRVGDAATARAWRQAGTLLVAAYQVGMAQRCVETATAYGLARHQFGRPVGSFQAVKHLLADMAVRAEVAHAASTRPPASSTTPTPAPPTGRCGAPSCSPARLRSRNAKGSLQVHGGIGFTWEVDVHLFLKRAWLLNATFGSPDAHAEALVP